MKAHEIQELVAIHFGLSMEKFLFGGKKRIYSRPRQVAMFLVRESTSLSFENIGRSFRGKDYTTVMAACRKVEEMMKESEKFADEVAVLRQKIKDRDRENLPPFVLS